MDGGSVQASSIMSRSSDIRRQLSCGPAGRRPEITGYTIIRTVPIKAGQIVKIENGHIYVDGVKIREMTDSEYTEWYLYRKIPVP